MYEPNSGATPEAAWMMNDPEDGSRLLLEAHAAPDPTGADTLGFSFSLWARRQGGWTEVMNGFNWGYSDAEELVDAAEAYLGYEPDDIERIGYGEFERALLLDEGLSSRAQRAKNVPAVEQVRRREGHRMGR